MAPITVEAEKYLHQQITKIMFLNLVISSQIFKNHIFISVSQSSHQGKSSDIIVFLGVAGWGSATVGWGGKPMNPQLGDLEDRASQLLTLMKLFRQAKFSSSCHVELRVVWSAKTT
jgi:hypothetical protein